MQIEVLNKHLLLTAKPIIYLINLSERDYIRKKNKWSVRFSHSLSSHTFTHVPSHTFTHVPSHTFTFSTITPSHMYHHTPSHMYHHTPSHMYHHTLLQPLFNHFIELLVLSVLRVSQPVADLIFHLSPPFLLNPSTPSHSSSFLTPSSLSSFLLPPPWSSSFFPYSPSPSSLFPSSPFPSSPPPLLPPSLPGYLRSRSG